MGDFNFDGPTANNESGILARLWRKILKENNLERLIPVLIERYLNKKADKTNEIPIVKKKNRSTIAGNVNAKEMTIKTFFDLLFNLIGVCRIELSVKITFPSGKESIHTVGITNRDQNSQSEVKDEVETGISNKDTK